MERTDLLPILSFMVLIARKSAYKKDHPPNRDNSRGSKAQGLVELNKVCRSLT